MTLTIEIYEEIKAHKPVEVWRGKYLQDTFGNLLHIKWKDRWTEDKKKRLGVEH